jgi:hypothetical protein
LIVKTAGSGLGEGISETHLHVRKARGLSTELPNWELGPSEGILAWGSNKDQGKVRSFSIPQ